MEPVLCMILFEIKAHLLLLNIFSYPAAPYFSFKYIFNNLISSIFMFLSFIETHQGRNSELKIIFSHLFLERALESITNCTSMGLISRLKPHVGKSLKGAKWILCANLRFTKGWGVGGGPYVIMQGRARCCSPSRTHSKYEKQPPFPFSCSVLINFHPS